MSEKMSKTRKVHQPAKTTIVGGQPPGNSRDMATVPVGLEELLGMAAVDGAFAEALLTDPPAASARAGGPIPITTPGLRASLPIARRPAVRAAARRATDH